MGILTKIKAKVFGSYAPGSGAFVPPPSWPIGWWQLGYRMPFSEANAAVEACVGAISQTMATLPLEHWRRTSQGGQERVKDSWIEALLRRPNAFQTRSDFILNLIRTELFTGNSVAAAVRDDRGRITSLHPFPSGIGVPHVATDGSIFYSMWSDPLAPEPPIERFWPQRDVLHLRLHTPRHPLVGESPITAAMMSVQAGNAISGHMAGFFSNMTRPSGYLTAPKALKPETAEKLREDWERAYSTGANSGRIAVLQDGLEWKAMSITSVDAQLIESYRLSVQDVARVYRVPLAVIGELGGATFNNTETLIQHWLSTGLSFMLEHVELSFDRLFELPADEFMAFDIEYLMRADFKTRVEGLTKGIIGGLFSPNEARMKEGLPRAENGDEPRLQAQVVPLSAAGAVVPSAPSAPVSEPDKPEPEEASFGMLKFRYFQELEDA